MSVPHTLKNTQVDNERSGQIIGAAIEVHRVLGGPGLLESIYEAALCHEFSLKKLKFQRQLPVPVRYKGIVIRDPLYLDLLVEGKIIVEVKATEQGPNHPSNAAAYLFTSHWHPLRIAD